MGIELNKNAKYITCSLFYANEWLSAEDMQSQFAWLNNISITGIEMYINTALKKGYLLEKEENGIFKYNSRRDNATKRMIDSIE